MNKIDLVELLEEGALNMSKPFHERYPLLIKYLGEGVGAGWLSDDDDEED